MYCTTELCLSVDKLEKDNKQRRNDVSCTVFHVMYISVHMLKTGNTYTPAQLQSLV